MIAHSLSFYLCVMQLIKLKSVDSTNTEARRRVHSTGRMNFAVSAEMQTAGRGRFNRVWQTPEGNIAVTLVVPRPEQRQDIASLSLVAGLAIHDALSLYISDADIRIKWPNDILVNGAKISGTLIEADSKALYIGIGINRVAAPADVPYATATLEQFSKNSADQILEMLIARWQDYFEIWSEMGFAALKNAYETRMYGLNAQVTISLDAEKSLKHTGECRGIDENGNILLESGDNAVQAYNYGDILILD
ncbi:biotin--[acetyl-CoA-carboxylase] ligase [Pantoea sp. KXB24]|uniref:biotin--[acetyl-CoA-carboxylase] ligase n=3 Tax=Pantoea TaxID=53335 RepID=UPI00344F87B2